MRSEVASWVYVAGPRVYFAAVVAATTLVPVVFAAAPLEAAGGILLLVGTLALGRFALATAALDTGSPFGGMGASRDMTIAALAEPALMLGLFASALAAGSMNLGVLVRTLVQEGVTLHPADILAFAGLFMIVIAETGRIPVDNPATHLELTMIHEAMVLEYAGPDLALVEWASAVKELLYLTLLVDLFMPIGIATSPAPGAVLVAIVAWVGKVAAGDCSDSGGKHEREAASVPGPGTGVDFPGSRVSGARDPVPLRSWLMTANVLILSAAGMLVTAYLMVGQKALFTTIRLYGVQSLLLAIVATTIADLRVTSRVVRHGGADRRTQDHPDSLVPDADGGPHRHSPRDRAIPERPCSLLVCLGLTVVGYRVSTGFEEGAPRRHPPSHRRGAVAAPDRAVPDGDATKAITQILALLTVENAVFLVAVGVTTGMPLIVELGIAFDVMLAVLVLGILVQRIVDRFESMDVSRLSKLKG